MADQEDALFIAAREAVEAHLTAVAHVDPGIRAIAHAIGLVMLCRDTGLDPGELLQRVRARLAQETAGGKAKVAQ